MLQWYYIENDRQEGPISEAECKSLFQTGRLSPEALVWTSELDDWEQAKNINGLVPEELKHLSLAYATTPTSHQYIPTGSQIRPWIRYWARIIDFMLFCIVFGVVASLIYEPLLDMHDTLFGMATLFIYAFVEPIMLSSWGTTPGKAIFSVRLRDATGDKLSYGDALKRSLDVWVRGLGLGIGIISIITQIAAYNRLTNEGMTSWDRTGDYSVQHRSISILRIISIIILFLCFLFLIALGAADI